MPGGLKISSCGTGGWGRGEILTLEESKQIHYIIKEIEVLKRELVELRMKNPYRENIITDMPRGGGGSDNLTAYTNDIMELEDMLNYALRKLQRERRKFEEFLNTVEDAEMRLILRLRCVNNMYWEDIGREIGAERTTVSKRFYKFFREQKDSHNSR